MGEVIDSDRFRGKAAASRGTGGNGGGIVDDILKRLSAVESSVADIRAHVSGIAAILPHLATKADVSVLRADIGSGETSIIKWTIGTMIACAALAFAIAKFVS